MRPQTEGHGRTANLAHLVAQECRVRVDIVQYCACKLRHNGEHQTLTPSLELGEHLVDESDDFCDPFRVVARRRKHVRERRRQRREHSRPQAVYHAVKVHQRARAEAPAGREERENAGRDAEHAVKLLGAARDLPQARAALGEPANALEAHPDIGIEKVVAAEAIKGHGARTPLDFVQKQRIALRQLPCAQLEV